MRLKLITLAGAACAAAYIVVGNQLDVDPPNEDDNSSSVTLPSETRVSISEPTEIPGLVDSNSFASDEVEPTLIEEPEPTGESQVINIGEYIDVDALPVYEDREPINIGEYIDVDALPPDDGSPPINIGDPLPPPDDPDYIPQSYTQPINVGDYLPPPDEYDPGIYGEYTEPVNIGEPIYIDEPL